jgi:SulP family sulfate permease
LRAADQSPKNTAAPPTDETAGTSPSSQRLRSLSGAIRRHALHFLQPLLTFPRPRHGYRWRALRGDVVAALTVSSVAVPQAMAYALIAGIEPIYGLYTAIVVTALGSLFGASRHLINGPTNAISLAVFAAVAELTTGPGDPTRIQMVSLLAILVGLIQILIGLLRLGDLTRYISEAVILGFMAGAGTLVALTQVQNFLGLHAVGGGQDHLLYRLWLTWTIGGPVDGSSVLIGTATLLLVFGLHRLGRRLRKRLPELLIALLVVSFAVWLLNLAPGGQVERLHLERELPSLHVPPLNQGWARQLWGSALAIALLGLVEALAISKAIAARTREALDYNRQCLAEGLANLGGGFFQCMPGSGSLTRSAINYFAGAVTRLSGIFAAAVVAVALLLFAPLAHYVPRAALAGVLLWTAGRIVDRRRLMYCLRATRFDAGIALATAFAAIFISVEFGLLIGVFLSFLFFVPRASRLHGTELVLSSEGVLRERRPNEAASERLVIFSLEGNVFFGAAPEFVQYLKELTRRADQGARVIVLDLKRVRSPDMVCLEQLQHFLGDMHARGVKVLLGGVREDLAQSLESLGFEDWLPRDQVFLEAAAPDASTRNAVRRGYELLDGKSAAGSRLPELPAEVDPGYYVI